MEFKPKKLKKLKHSWDGDECTTQENPEADLFEQEMNAELEDRLEKAELDGGFGPRSSSSRSEAVASTSKDIDSNSHRYDNIYFDSDDEDADEDGRQLLSNDDLLYDPNMDEEDQAWVDNIRNQYQKQKNSHKSGTQSNLEAPSTSDAVLNCPACFGLLCLDCQRHESYHHQYRAMFVMNCVVNHEEKLSFPKSKKERKGKKKHKQETSLDPNEVFHPVKCVKCSTQVGVFDTDEVYHFFNVVASHT